MKYYLIILTLILHVAAIAQPLDFQNLTMADGLSGSRVNTIGQDKYGFIWIGTENGLNIYDGIRFKHYFANDDTRSLPGNRISDFVFDSDSVWIATRSGLCKMDIITKECRIFDLGSNLDVRTLLLEENGNTLWVGTASGLLRLNTTTGAFRDYNTANCNISHNTIRAIYKDKKQNLWVGTYDKLNVLKPQSDVFKIFNLKTKEKTNLAYNLVLSICPYSETNDKQLWVGTETGLVLFNSDTEDMRYFHEENSNLSNSVIKTIHQSTSGSLWLGTDFGLGRMDDDFNISTYFHDINNRTSLANSIVWDVFEDSSGTLWYGTNNGLSVLSNTTARFEFVPISYRFRANEVGYEIRDIIETSDNNLWIASQNGAIHYGKNNQQIEVLNSSQDGKRKLVEDNTSNLLEDGLGNIWIGTNGGLSVWNPEKESLQSFSADKNSDKGLRSNYVLALYELKDGNLLINTQKGLHKAIKRNGTIEFEYIRNMGFSSAIGDDFLWALQYSRILKIDPNTLETIDNIEFEQNGKYINFHSILVDGANTVWLGAEDGLMQFDIQTKEYKYHELKSDKSFPLISLLKDDDGNIWAASYSAIVKFTQETGAFEIYPSGFEIPITRFTEGACLKTKEGDLIFGGQDGFIRFTPDKITKSNFIAPVLFTNLIVSNQEVKSNSSINGKNILDNEIAFTSEIDLDHINKSFTVEFSSLHFGSREGIRYAYKLEGEESEWKYINGPVGTANYSNLKPGNYVLKVKGTNVDGVWNPQETVLHVRIHPPNWAKPIFIVIYIIAFVVVVGIIIIYFRNRARFRNELKLTKLEKEHTEELSQTRQRFFTNISHEFRTPLSLIIGPTEKLEKQKELSSTSKDYVRIIENNARRLLWLNNQLLDFRKLEKEKLVLALSEFEFIQFTKNVYELFGDKAERKNINYKFQSDFEQLNVFMDVRKVETILFNLLSNAFKFTPENGEITLTIESELKNTNGSGEAIVIRVKDTGIGIPKEEQNKIFERFYQANEAVKMERGSGIGLTLVKEYVNMHKGELLLTSEVGKGSEFSITLPLLTETEANEYLLAERQEKPLLKPESKTAVHTQSVTIPSGAPLILLVEDDKEIRDFISLGFKNKYNIKIAKNGKEALSIVTQKTPALVISDINMPEMDGIEFTKRFKANPKTAHIPLILLTGQTQQELQLEGLKSGADAYMSKPFEFELLELRVDNFLKRQELYSSFLKVKDITKPKEVQITTQDERLLEKVVASIEKFISDPDLNIEKVCDDTGFSHSMLYRKIKNLTGQTLNEFIRTIRVQRAEQLLRTKKFNVAEVMHETGFTNHSYFSKAFRKLYKVSPKEYIKNI